jgi:signal transduction histidine kinase/DNA-binding response OmpR family regulator
MSKQILLIDEDKSHADALKKYLERQLYDVTLSVSSEDMFLKLDNYSWDILLVDPFINGGGTTVEYLISYKNASSLTQIVLITDPDDLDKAMTELGKNAVGYVTRPASSLQLDLALRNAKTLINLSRQNQTYSRRLSEMQSAHNLLNQLFEEVPCYISVQNKDLKITAANNMFKKDFGSHIGGYCFETYKHRTAPCPECPVVETFHDGKSHTTEEIVTSKSGKQYNVLTQTAPLRNENNEITQVMEMSSNITQIRQLQDHLTSLGLMLGSMSHGVKGMLTALDGGLYQLESGLNKKDMKKIENAFELVSQMADKIKKMVLEILYYAKSRELNYKETDLNQMAENIVKTASPDIDKNDFEFDVCIEKDLGVIEIDPNWVEAAIVNFLENAVDACASDRNKTDHKISFIVGAVENDGVYFRITDNGIGIDQETKEKMFTLFFSSKGSQGTGLGLFIAHRVIKQHGGKIQVETWPDKGTAFTITLPRKAPEQGKMIKFRHENE